MNKVLIIVLLLGAALVVGAILLSDGTTDEPPDSTSDNTPDNTPDDTPDDTPTNQPPVADAGSDQTVDKGDTVNLQGTGSDSDGSIVKYEWDFDGDGTYDWDSTSTGSTTHTYTIANTYTAKLRVTDDDDSTHTNTCLITVNPASRADILSDNSYVDIIDYLHVVGELQNTGDTNLNFVKVTATFYDSNNAVIGTDFTYTTIDIIVPGQKSPFEVLANSGSFTGILDHYSLQTSFSFTLNEPQGNLDILSSSDYVDTIDYHHIVGEVQNTGTITAEFVKVIATYYDSDGEVIAVSYTYTDPSDITAGATAPFDVLQSTDNIPGTIASYVLHVDA